MGNLYEIINEIEMLLESDLSVEENIIDNNTGKIVSVGARLDKLEIDQKTKFENLALYIKNITADAEAIRNEEKTLADRRRVLENQAERLKAYLTMNLQMAGFEKFETPRCKMSFRKSTSVEIDENANIPKDYVTIKVTETPNKKMITDAIKEGELIDGCRLVEKYNLQIK